VSERAAGWSLALHGAMWGLAVWALTQGAERIGAEWVWMAGGYALIGSVTSAAFLGRKVRSSSRLRWPLAACAVAHVGLSIWVWMRIASWLTS
jgi:hypothetical protein